MVRKHCNIRTYVFVNRIVHLYFEDGRTLKSLVDEYSFSHANITYGINQFRKEYQVNNKARVNYISKY